MCHRWWWGCLCDSFIYLGYGFNLLTPEKSWRDLKKKDKSWFADRYLQIYWWKYPQINDTGPYWWKVDIGSGNGLMPSTHYLSQRWPKSILPYDVTRAQRVWNICPNCCVLLLILISVWRYFYISYCIASYHLDIMFLAYNYWNVHTCLDYYKYNKHPSSRFVLLLPISVTLVDMWLLIHDVIKVNPW